MPGKKLIRRVRIRGTVQHVRAALDKLSDWRSSSGEPLLIEDVGRALPAPLARFILTRTNPPTRGTWRIGLWNNTASVSRITAAGMIEAYELHPDQTTIEFWDGISEKIKPIGQPFREFCDTVIEELESSAESQLEALPIEGNNKSTVRPPKEYLAQRRQAVKQLSGKTAEQIAEELERMGFKGTSVATVNRDLKEIGMVQKRYTKKTRRHNRKMTKK